MTELPTQEFTVTMPDGARRVFRGYGSYSWSSAGGYVGTHLADGSYRILFPSGVTVDIRDLPAEDPQRDPLPPQEEFQLAAQREVDGICTA